MRKAIIVCVLLALSGLLALLALDKSGEAPQRSAEKTVTVEIEEEQESPEPAASGDIQDLLENDLGEAPPPEAVEEAAKMARGIRERARRTLERADAIAAAQVARRIKEEREAAEQLRRDLARGGVMTLLRGLKDRRGHPFSLVEDLKEFGELFERKVSGPTWDGTTLKPNETIPDGTTIVFPPGQFTWGIGRLGRGKAPFPADLLVLGSGMDDTIVRLNEIQSRHQIRSLTFRDMTIDCGDDYLTDLRSENPTVIRLDRCRVVAFDMGAGGSVMLDAHTAAFYATDCRFEAGFGRSPGSGNLFRVRDGLLVRCERCIFRGPFDSYFDRDGDATYLFSDCEFLGIPEDSRYEFERRSNGVRFQRCSFAYISRSEQSEARRRGKRQLSEINPDWRNRK
ncbi:MAG: hypothetical protein ACYSX0_19275 [Planctomycetota bacterium]|jgi:hypothetical protein